MSLVFAAIEVAAGPSVGLKEPVSLPVFLPPEIKTEEKGLLVGRRRNGFSFDRPSELAAADAAAPQEEDDVSTESSSIGVESSSSSSDQGSDGQEEEEVESKPKDGALASLESLEESLPVKRGLSNYFVGKSKSFASLSECANSNARDVVKPENPFNKRRRILMAHKTSSWSRRASCSSLITSLPPLLSPDFTLEEAEEEEDHDRGGREDSPSSSSAKTPLFYNGGDHQRDMINKKAAAFRSPRSFSLSDLHHV